MIKSFGVNTSKILRFDPSIMKIGRVVQKLCQKYVFLQKVKILTFYIVKFLSNGIYFLKKRTIRTLELKKLVKFEF